MEEKIRKHIYFLYTQKGDKNNITAIETNAKVRQVKEIFKELHNNYLQILYKVELLVNNDENKINIALLHNNGDSYYAHISLYPTELDKCINSTDIIIFKVLFKPYLLNDGGDLLNQILLPNNEQFHIFERSFSNQENIIINLYSSIISQVFLNSKETFSFILDFFLKIYDKNKIMRIPKLKIILKYFFKNIVKILRNCEVIKPLKISEEKVSMLYDTENIKNNLINITDEEENIDIFLAFYYIHFQKKSFIKFISNKKYKDKIILTLKSNRKIFKNFTTEIITSDVMLEAENGYELLSLMSLYPNIVECFKILADCLVFYKFTLFKRNEGRFIGIMNIQEPKKTDNMDLLNEYFNKCYEYFLDDGEYPLNIRENFFIKYYQIFAEQDEDFHKNKIIIDMLIKYNSSKLIIKINPEKIFNLHLAKGLSLLKSKKLKNIELIKFLDFVISISANKDEIVKFFHNGIEFSENDNLFLNDILNTDKYQLKEKLGNSYHIVLEKIFENFSLPKELTVLIGWNIGENTPEIIIEIFLKTIKRIWLKFPENHMYGLYILFAMEFATASYKLNNYKYFLDELEAKIVKEKLMAIYSQIFYQRLKTSIEFKNRIREYIKSYNKVTPLYLWYLMCTYETESSRIDFLSRNLENGNNHEYYIVSYSDFSDYPSKIQEKISLFTNIRNTKYLNDYFMYSDYYKKSFQSKYELTKNTFKDGLKMQSNLQKIQNLLEDFFIEQDDNINEICDITINFTEIIDKAKIYNNSLKLIQNFWKTFYPKSKKDELVNLKKIITKFENTKIEDCLNNANLDKNYFGWLEEAEKGIKLKESIIFMEIYNSLNEIKESEEENYKLSVEKFNNIKKLRENCNLDILEKDIEKYIVDAVYKSFDLLNEELNFIKNYFKFGEDNNKDNFDMKIIRNQIINLVKIKQKMKGVYRINIYEKLKTYIDEEVEEEEIENDEIKQDNENNKNKSINDKFSNNTLVLFEGKSSDFKNMYMEEIFKMKEELECLSGLIFHKSMVFDNSNQNETKKFYETFSKFYIKIFEFGVSFGKLFLEDIYEKIILKSNKIFCLGKNFGILNNIQNYEFQGELLLISELNYFLQLIEKYQKIDKKTYVNIFIVFNRLYINSRKEGNFVEDDINKLFKVTEDYITEKLNNIFLEVLLNEYQKYKDINIVKYILKHKFHEIYGDMIPIMDLILNEEILKKLNYRNIVDNNNYMEFNSNEFREIDKICDENEDFAEMILFYFENKIMNEMKNTNKTEKEFFDDENISEFLKFCLEFLELKFDKKKVINISILFSIAFVKCYLYKLIKFSYKNPDQLEDDNLFKGITKFGHKALKPFRTTVKYFMLKLLYSCCENLSNFSKLDLKPFYIMEREININNNFGFDYMLIPLQLNIKDDTYDSIRLKLNIRTDLEIIEIITDDEINEEIKNNIDLFFCISINFLFSFYYNKNIYNDKEDNQIYNLYNWISEKIKNQEIESINRNKDIEKIFFYFMNIDGKKKVYEEFTNFKYDQILCLLLSARFVLRTISSDIKDSFYYKLFFDAKKVIDDKMVIFTEYYLKDFDINIIDKRKLSCLAYKLINYIILSHIFFGFKTNHIKSEEIKKILLLNNLKNNDKKNISDYILENLFREFDFIKNILIPLLGINNFIIFMDSFFKELIKKIFDIKSNISIDDFINKNDQIFDEAANNIITHYANSVNEYYKYENIEKKDKNGIKDTIMDNISKRYNDDDILDILLEKPKLYNDQEKLDMEYPLLSYFTYTNFSVLNDDFRSQYIYYYFSINDYPFLSSIFSSDAIFCVINYIPKLNKLSNKVYDKLNMKIIQEDIKSKTIKELFNNELNQDLEEYNDFIEKNKKLFDINKKIQKINNEKTLYEIINIPGSNINYIYKKIIEIYNNFLKKMKYGINNELIDCVIIQEAKESDYNFTHILNIENNKKFTIKEKLDELILLYSKRKRKNNNLINVYNGGKIIYDFEIIENKLEEQFIFGKKYFSGEQRAITFYNEIFEKEYNILKEFEKKYPQIKKNNEYIQKFGEYLDKISEGNKSNSLDLFYELFFIFKYLSQNIIDFNIDNDEKSIDDIVKYFELKSYKLPEITKAKNSLNNCLLLNNICHFYEKVFNRAFINLKKELDKKELDNKINIEEETENKINEILKSNNIITYDVLITAFEKYIMKYIKNKDDYLFDFKSLKEKKDVWAISIDFTKEFFEEFNKLLEINSDGDKNIIKYCYMMVYDIMNDDGNDNEYNREDEEEKME